VNLVERCKFLNGIPKINLTRFGECQVFLFR